MAHHEYSDNYNKIFYEAQELMKIDAYETLHDNSASYEKRVSAVEQIMKSHFLRSVDNFVSRYGKRKEHPSFHKFVSMLLDQESYCRNFIPEDIKQDLICKYGTIHGMTGSYYTPDKK